MIVKQKTLKKKIFILGVGLHSGNRVNLVIKPADVDTGIIFKRDDKFIKATYDNVINTHLGTTIGINNNFQKFFSNFFAKFGIIKEYGVVVRTIEHIMASLWACDIDNAIIELNNKEIPIMDGSSFLFINEIKKVGVVEQNKDRKFLVVKKIIELVDKDRYIRLFPYDGYRIDLTVNFNYGNIGEQNSLFYGDKADFIKNFSKARTFCNIKDIVLMQKHNLARGGSEENSMIFDERKLVNKNGFKYENEVVKHKLLDCIGDMFTSGYYMKCFIHSNKSGHTMDYKILKKLFSDKNNYEII